MLRYPFLTWLILMTATAVSADGLLFERDIRPILKTHCFHCHGEDGVQESDLDLRLRRWIVAGGESGPSIEPGDPSSSLLLDRISSGEMPPGDKLLPESDIEKIRQWIARGAPTARKEPETVSEEDLITEEDKLFWAFQPIVRPEIPNVSHPELTQNPIDNFILARLESQELSFSEAVDRYPFMRRIHMDILGLPPTPEDVKRYATNASPTATKQLIEQLLASPAYGEKWGRHWLDIAGYADSEGYTEDDRVRESAFRYRDYVIRAFNADKKMDQFIREQLAGDELASSSTTLTDDDVQKLTATGFLRMAADGTASSGIDQDLARNQTMSDTIEIVSTSLMGLTVGCAKCHNHRYDPISQIDYYRIRAIFEPALDWKSWRNPPARQISLYSDAERQKKKDIENEVASVAAAKKEKTEYYISLTLEEELSELDESLREPLRTAYTTPSDKRTAEHKQLLKEYPSVQNISPGSLYLYDRRRDEQARGLDTLRSKKEQQFINETRQRSIAEAPLDVQESLRDATGIKASERSQQQQDLLKKYPAVLVTKSNLATFNAEAAAELKELTERATLFRKTKSADDLKSYTDQIAEIRQRIPKEGFIRALTEPKGHQPATYLFHRGDHQQPLQKVAPGGLSILRASQAIAPQSESLATTGRRLAFAKHLTSGDHPLVARVIVNRIWAQFFGRGIVASLGDFGKLGERPTHPELLDWLTSEFVRSGWQMKHLQRLILSSATYQQSSRRRASLEEVDPDNLLLGRMPVRRLESEALRDSLLAVSGELNRDMYGQAVPVREDEVGQIVIGKEMLDGERKPVKGSGLGGQELRRSIYVQVRRSRPLAVLETFDAPRMTPNCSQRSVSNVAPQPLMMMNSDFSIRCSERFAERIRKEVGQQTPQQAVRAWELAFGRAPEDGELQAAIQYLEQQAKSLPDNKDPLATLCHALISTNQFLYID